MWGDIPHLGGASRHHGRHPIHGGPFEPLPPPPSPTQIVWPATAATQAARATQNQTKPTHRGWKPSER